MKQYNLLNVVMGWVVFVVAAITYILTLESTASFWDCGEFIASAYKLEVGHPPGNPIFMLTARFFANFASDPSQVAYMVNLMSGLLSAGAIMFLFWTITYLAKKLIVTEERPMTTARMITILGCGLVGALAYAWSDTFWFSAVEGEVYAYSSFCTAVVFWLILKWDSVADEPYANRFLILIAYLIGVSIAVHLLNLLCIPAIVLVYYYRRFKNVNAKGSLIALLASFAIIVLLLYGLIPGFVKVAGLFEIFCVNVLKMPYNTGVIIYFFITLASISWAIYESYKQRHELYIKLSFLLSVVLVGILFIGDGIWIGLLLTTALVAYLLLAKKTPVIAMNTIMAGLLVIFLGYSSYALIIIRSTANTPMDQNSPQDVFTLASYLARDQYGDNPLFYGRTFASQVKRDESGKPVVKEGKKIMRQVVKTDENEPDRYIEIGREEEYVYEDELNMLFPRMYSEKPNHISAYKEWSGFKGHNVTVNTPQGPKTVKNPTFGENLRFFLDYQLNYMYWRYFLWNFVGRQNDIQGHGEVDKGNWISGIKFIDKFIEGDSTYLPDDMKDNPGRNVFYFMPLILGLIGLLFQAYSGKRGIEQFWVVFFLFFMTGIAIVLYLNQTPYQPRERDYAYAGSFYAFAIWIGLGVAAITRFLEWVMEKCKVENRTVVAVVAVLLCMVVPLQVVSQTWDDHDRSGRYVARDFGMNYLSSVEPNAILFTNGDNDTFPLWYAQEVEGYRTDVRVCNLSYLQTDWYIDQMKRPAYESAPLPISATPTIYAYDKRAYNYVIPRVEDSLTVREALNFLYSDEAWTKELPSYGMINHLPTNKLYIPVDPAVAHDSAGVPDKYIDKIVDKIVPNFAGKTGFTMSEIASLDLINTNIEQGWKRPVYFAVTVSNSLYLGLDDYFVRTGMAYHLVPVKNEGMGVDTERMYDNMMTKFKWGGLDKATPEHPLYLDENVRRMCQTIRLMFSELVNSLIEEGENEKALAALDFVMEKIPGWQVRHDLASMQMAESYLKLGANDKGLVLLRDIVGNSIQYMRWYQTLTPSQLRSVGDYNLHAYIIQAGLTMLVEAGMQTEAEQIIADAQASGLAM